MMRKQFFAFPLILFCFFFISASYTFAARSVSIASDKISLFGDEELTLSASMSGFVDNETIYIKGAFFKEGSTNYFGYTKNGESWIKNSKTALQQRAVQVGNFDGFVVVRSDFEDSGYSGSGNYNLKLGFYYITSGGNVSSVNWSSNFLTINLDQPIPTPTPTKEVQLITPLVTLAQITKSPTLTKMPTKTPTPSKILITAAAQKNVTSAKISNVQEKPNVQPTKILSLTKKKEIKKEAQVLGAKSSNLPFAPILTGGILLIGAGGWLVFRNSDQIKIWIEKLLQKTA